MNKLNWKAKLIHEFTPNYKILQQSFSKCGIPKYIDVERLQKGKPQDNLEFLQWIKRYHDLNYKPGNVYDPVERRNGEDLYIEDSKLKITSKSLQPKSKKNILSKENLKKLEKKQYTKDVNNDITEIAENIENAENVASNKQEKNNNNNNNIKVIKHSNDNKQDNKKTKKQLEVDNDIIPFEQPQIQRPNQILTHDNTKITLENTSETPCLITNQEHTQGQIQNQEHSKNNIFKGEYLIAPPSKKMDLDDVLTQHTNYNKNSSKIKVVTLTPMKINTKPKINNINVVKLTEEFEILSTLKDEIKEIKSENSIFKKCLSDVSKERDFYLSKLRNFEYLLIKVSESDMKKDVIEKMSQILYATTDVDLTLDEHGVVQIKN